MLRTAMLALAGLTGTCGQGDPVREADVTEGSEAPAVARAEAKGRVIDLADVFEPDAEREMASELTFAEQRTGRRVTLVTVVPTAGDSMERIGWAVGGRGKQPPILLLIDPSTKSVRIEGDLSPSRKASVAGTIRNGLVAGNLPAVLPGALAMLERTS